MSDIIIIFSVIFPVEGDDDELPMFTMTLFFIELIILGLLITFRARASFSSFLGFRSKKTSENER